MSRITHTVALSSAIGSIVAVSSHFIFLIIIKYYCSYNPFVSTCYSSLFWHLLEIENIYDILCSANKEHVVIQFWPQINVAAAELSIFLILSGQIKIGKYNCHPVRNHVF